MPVCCISGCHSPLRIHTAGFAATIWTKANEIMKDVYNQIILISTIAAVVTASVALLMMNFSKSGKPWTNHVHGSSVSSLPGRS